MKLIINADDFGASEGINNNILKLHKLGVVSSTTIIANGSSFKSAVDIAKDNPNLGIGIHLCLDGPFNIGKDYKTILDKSTNQFYNSTQIIKKLREFRVEESEIYKEYSLQIEKVLDHKIKISHLDTHHHLHVLPLALESIIKAAKKYKIRHIRSEKIYFRNNQSNMNYLLRYAHQIYLKIRIKAVDGIFEPGITKLSNYDDCYLRLSKLVMLNDKTIEIVLHLNDSNPEISFFTSERVLSLLSNQDIINYHDL